MAERAPKFDDLYVGYALPVFDAPRITRTTLALFAGGSGDHIAVHIDTDFARAAGYDDVFSHGMLSMAFLGRLLESWAPKTCVRSFSARFVAVTPVNADVICTGEVMEMFERDGEKLVRVVLQAQLRTGEKTIIGEALVACE